MNAERTSQRGIILTFLAIYIFYCLIFVARTIAVIHGRVYFSLFDDAMISMRYAENLVAGNGLVWNPGEYVEGYTDPLWVMLMAAVISIFGKALAPLAMQIIGIALSGLTCIVGGLAAVELYDQQKANAAGKDRAVVTITTLVLIATFYPLQYWSLLGMEVSALALFAAYAALTLVRFRSGRLTVTHAMVRFWVLITLSYFVRPDGFLALLPLLVPIFWEIRRRGSWREWTVFYMGALAAIFCAGLHLLWRRWYYGSSLPNTYVLKVVGYSFSLRMSNGINFIRTFFLQYLPFLPFVLVATFLGIKRSMTWPLMAGFLLACAYQVYVGGDAWIYWRQLTPGAVLVFIATAPVAPKLISWMQHQLRPSVNKYLRTHRSAVVIFSTFSLAATLALMGLIAAAGMKLAPRMGLNGQTLLEIEILLGICLAVGVKLIGETRGGGGDVLRPYFFGAIALLVIVLITNAPFNAEIFFLRPIATVDINRSSIAMAVALRNILTPNSFIAAFNAGALPYYWDGKATDGLGKTDAHIAKLPIRKQDAYGMHSRPGHAKYDLQYTILFKKPDFTESWDYGDDNVTPLLRGVYVLADYEGQKFCLRRASPNVHWNLVRILGDCI